MNRAKRRVFASKLRAKYFLRTNLPKCMAAALIVYGLSSAGSLAASMFLPDPNSVLNYTDLFQYLSMWKYFAVVLALDIIISPLQMAFFWFLSELSMLRNVKFKDSLFWINDLKHFFGAIGAKLRYYLIVLRDTSILFVLPVGAMLLAERYLSKKVSAAIPMITYTGIIVMLAGVVIITLDVLSYRPALYLYASSPERGINTVFKECRAFMAHRKGEFVMLHVSLIGWFLAEIFTSGLIMIYSRPFYDFTILVYTQYAYKLWLVDTGKLPREMFEFPLPGLPEFDSGWLW